MTTVTDAAHELKDLYDRLGNMKAFPGSYATPPKTAPGAIDEQIAEIKQTFADLEFPLPNELLEIYRITLGIPSVLGHDPMLNSPCIFSHFNVHLMSFLINQEDEADKGGLLWLGHGTGTGTNFIMNRDGQCGLHIAYDANEMPYLADSRTLSEVFPAFVEMQVKAICEEYAGELAVGREST